MRLRHQSELLGFMFLGANIACDVRHVKMPPLSPPRMKVHYEGGMSILDVRFDIATSP